MPETNLQVPTLSELVTRIRDDFDAQLPAEGSKIRRSFLYVTSAVLAGAVHSLYGLAKQISKNIVFDRIEDVEILERISAVWDIERDPGTAAKLTVRFSGVAATAIPISTEILRDSGFAYTTDAAATIGGGGTVDVEVTATEEGSSGTVDDLSEELSIASPIAGVSSTVSIVSATVDGADEEGVESLRTRLIDEIRTPKQGGAAADYVAWAREAPNLSGDVTRVWIGQELGAGTVTVWFAIEGTGSGVIPSSADVSAVGNYIGEVDHHGHSMRRPVTASVSVGAPVAEPVDLTIGVSPYSSEVTAAIEEELETMFRTRANVKRTGFGGDTIQNAHIHGAIVRVIQRGILDYYTLDSVDGGAGSADISPSSVGDLPVLGTVSWVSL